MIDQQRIYLDYAATTPLDPAVAERMIEVIQTVQGNPSSMYHEGRKARQVLDDARSCLATALGCQFGEIIFTGSGTEAANQAVVGTAFARRDGKRKRILVSAIEHHCVLHLREPLHALGYSLEFIPVSRDFVVNLECLQAMLDDDVLLVSVMAINNEVGSVQPTAEVSRLARSVGALFHCDITQSFGTDLMKGENICAKYDADFLNASAHKIFGPKGIGFLYAKAGTKPKPIVFGGAQEREMRAGTENVVGIAGFAEAVRRMQQAEAKGEARIARDTFLARLTEADLKFDVAVPEDSRSEHHAYLIFRGIRADALIILLDRMGVSCSTGSACSSGSMEPSHVLTAAGYGPEDAKSGVRFSFSHQVSKEEAEEAANRVVAAVRKLVQ